MKTKFLTLLLGTLLLTSPAFSEEEVLVDPADREGCSRCALLQAIEKNTSATANYLAKALDMFSVAFFGKLPSLGLSMASMTAMPSIEESAFADQIDMTTTLEEFYQGQTDGTTATVNYNEIYKDYLLNVDNAATSFDPANASASSLFLNQSDAYYYSEAQKSAAQTYMAILSASGTSKLQKPDASWLSVTDSSNSYEQNLQIMDYVTAYYQLAAAQSLVDHNLTYIYAENTGQNMDEELENYPESKISESALLHYYLSEKLYNTNWHASLGAMGFGAAIKEGVELLGAILLETRRIETLQKMQLATNSATLAIGLQTSSQLLEATKQQIDS
jgi:hypothetical protein